MKKRILTVLLVLVLMHNMAISASAAHPVPDLSKNGSITFEMVKNGNLLDGGSLNLCKVGDIQEDDGNYSFVLIEELKDSNVDLQTPSDFDVADALLELVKGRPLTIQNAPIVKGKATFGELPVGLYLVWQDTEDVTKDYSPIHPFLISIPQRDGDQYILDIVAKPKVPLETKPTCPPPPTPPPNLPKTGQLNWPIPVMAVVGCMLFGIGLMLYGGRKRTDDDQT